MLMGKEFFEGAKFFERVLSSVLVHREDFFGITFEPADGDAGIRSKNENLPGSFETADIF